MYRAVIASTSSPHTKCMGHTAPKIILPNF